MPDHHYENPRLVALYDLDSGWSEDRDFYLNLPRKAVERILDLGCGTGLLCDAYAARGHDVVGLDPAPAMLEAAKAKEFGDRVSWVLGDAGSYIADKKFDLIIMTGHAFQVLLDDEEIERTFATMASNIKDDGRIVFESRNPAPEIDWKEKWNYSLTIELEGCSVEESRKFMQMVGDRMQFELHYQFPEKTYVSHSELRFLSAAEIQDFATKSGLKATTIYGDWDMSPFDESLSEEMIFILEKIKI